jgi:Xaa-Pro dipeptidase
MGEGRKTFAPGVTSYTLRMGLDISAVQSALAGAGLDGWLLYDFSGSNPIARTLAGLDGASKMTTRRWYYLIPTSGEPRKLVHRIEAHVLDALPGQSHAYAGRQALEQGLDILLGGCRRVAMEYSPRNAIPYLSRVDAGTLEQVQAAGVDVVSSGDLVQAFAAVWSDAEVATHDEAAAALYRVKDRAFDRLRGVAAGRDLTEYALQQQMLAWFAEEGLVTDAPPLVAAMANAGDPHYQPTADRHRAIGPNELVQLDLWGKTAATTAVFADISWVGFTGTDVPEEMTRAFAAVVGARDAAIRLIETRLEHGEPVRGYEVDRAARAVLEEAGYGNHILHRTGHSLGVSVHGQGVHMDDYETHDDRQLLPGTGFTVEPGVYFETFGVRTEINAVVEGRTLRVTGPRQMEIARLSA